MDTAGRANLYRARSSALMTSTEISRLSCPNCKKILRDPRQVTVCGCRFCAGCIDQRPAQGCRQVMHEIIVHSMSFSLRCMPQLNVMRVYTSACARCVAIFSVCSWRAIGQWGSYITTQYCFIHSAESVFTCAVDGAKYERRDVSNNDVKG